MNRSPFAINYDGTAAVGLTATLGSSYPGRTVLNDARTCTSCRYSLPDEAAFCPRCGLAVAGLDPEGEVAFIDQLARHPTVDRSEVTGEAQRGGFRRGVLVVLAIIAALSAWALARAPSVEQGEAESATEDGEEASGPAMLGRSDSSVDESGDGDAPDSSIADADDSGDDAGVELSLEPRVRPLDDVPLGTFTGAGLQLYLSDGDDVERIDLATGERTRARGLGLPITVHEDRLILYRNGELYSLPQDNLAAIPFILRRVDDPIGVLWATAPGDPPVPVASRDGRAVWWPVAGTEIRWQRIRLSDGELEDDVALESAVGGPEVASAIGNGIYERVDGSWVKRREGYILAAGRDTAIGYGCDDPSSCQAALYELSGWEEIPLDIDVWELAEFRLIDGANLALGLSSTGIYDLVTDERLVDVSWSGSPTAVAAGDIVAVTHAGGVDLFNVKTGQVTSIDGEDLEPVRALLVGPAVNAAEVDPAG